MGGYANDTKITNGTDFKDWAIFKFKLGGKDTTVYADALEKLTDKKTKLCIIIDAHNPNSIPSNHVGYEGYDGELDHSEEPNCWLDSDGKWFELSKLSLNIPKGLNWLDTLDISMTERKSGNKFIVTYANDSGNLRTDISEEGEKQMDCSELVCRYLQKIGWSEKVKLLSTAMLYNYAKKNPNELKINDSEEYKPKKGDVFVWKSNSGKMGHTGVVFDYNQSTDVVTTIESITASSLARENSKAFQKTENNSVKYRFTFGGVIKCIWNRKEYHLIGHKKTGYSDCRFYTPLKKQ